MLGAWTESQDLLPSAFLSSFYPQWVSDSYHRGRLLHWSLREARQVTLDLCDRDFFWPFRIVSPGMGKPPPPMLLQSLKQRHEPEPVPFSHTPELAESREHFLFRHRAIGFPFEASVLPRGWLWLLLTRADSRGLSTDAHPTPERAWGLSLAPFLAATENGQAPANGAFQNVPVTICDVGETAENLLLTKWNRWVSAMLRKSRTTKTRGQVTVRLAGIAQAAVPPTDCCFAHTMSNINGVRRERDGRCHSASTGFTLEIAENHTTPDA
ncbi:predicted protein [Verticillium alfalfae VaMs.102]|uniref:Predicted protein n=1 Tax=Verticillium alfalfae (strain VaMs.102 / ATCC MYA-4576 / FGSC 10136) TaxID=526221 RepID=C9S7X9_VERA1|nr:predicted protein [Verticillium alfalfae VaMs.102]EEY14864.1 predicted protein [Verticillium alfalfae VaMs.102]